LTKKNFPEEEENISSKLLTEETNPHWKCKKLRQNKLKYAKIRQNTPKYAVFLANFDKNNSSLVVGQNRSKIRRILAYFGVIWRISVYFGVLLYILAYFSVIYR
jgi:hypothetical protein